MRNWFNTGTPWIWLNAGAVSCSLLLLIALSGLLLVKGLGHFWPPAIVQLTVKNTGNEAIHTVLGELLHYEAHSTSHDNKAERYLIRLGTEQPGKRLQWYNGSDVSNISYPVQAAMVASGDGYYWYGILQPASDGQIVLQLADGRFRSFDAGNSELWLPNQWSVWHKLVQYCRSLWQFVSSASEHSAGNGIFPAIFGTVIMVLLMSVIVTPIGVLAAVYLHEYARQGLLVRLIRISVYNLAGVPSIVFGVFGLGFFVYILGGSIDRLFYADQLPSPVFGTPGLLWVSLTMALLTLPVVIVSTEEGLARIPAELRLGAYALGATRAEMLWKVVLPLATPAMITGLILAIARAAGEVAPLLFVGVVKLAPALPVDGTFPYVHLDRKIMHLGYQIYDSGLQSPDADATQSLVYITALVLVLLILLLNTVAFRIRNRLRRKYQH